MARLEPLGVQAVRSKLERDHLFVPVLPAPDKMTPDDLVLVWMHGSDDDLEAELASWTDSRGEEQAARELLAFAADGNAATRTAAITIVSRLGQAAEPAWREALDRVELRCYAKPQLAKLSPRLARRHVNADAQAPSMWTQSPPGMPRRAGTRAPSIRLRLAPRPPTGLPDRQCPRRAARH